MDLDISFSFGPDIVFSLGAEKPISHQTKREKKVVGVNIRPQFWWTDSFCYSVNETLIASVLDRLIEERNVKIVFMPFRLSGKESHSDVAAAEEVLKNMRHQNSAEIFVCPLNETLFSSVEASYQTFDFFIGMALHSLIVACKYSVPFLAIPYQKKCEMLMLDQGLKDFIVNSVELSSADLLFDRILSEFDKRYQTQSSLSSITKNLRVSSLEAHLSNLLCHCS